MRGRRAQPEAVKAAKGNTGRRPTPASRPSVDAAPASGTLPTWLQTKKRIRKAAAERATDLAGEIWAKLQPELARMNLVKMSDEMALGRFCRYMAEWIVYTDILDKEGTFYITTSQFAGELRRPHPAFKQRKDVEQHLKDLGDVLGLSPSARQRLQLQLANNQGLGATPGAHGQPGAGANGDSQTEGGGEQLPMPIAGAVGMLGNRTVQ